MMLTWKYISGKHNFKHFNYIHVVEIPTKWESTHENAQSCPTNEKTEYKVQST